MGKGDWTNHSDRRQPIHAPLFALRKLGTRANELVKTGRSAEDEARHQQPRACSQPPIQEPAEAQPTGDRREQGERRGISKAGFAIDFLWVFV